MDQIVNGMIKSIEHFIRSGTAVPKGWVNQVMYPTIRDLNVHTL